ncbi:MAG TPA: MFS transporter [Acidimicrobiales bacterium]|nr:MFS transporter [Acidimicrobiales bacterium]
MHTARRAQGRLDVIGLALGGSGLALFIFGLAQSRNWGWDSPGTIGFLLGGLALLATFTLHALRASEPLLELRLIRTPIYLSSLLVIGLVTLPQYARAVFVPLQLERLRGYSALKVGVILTPSAVMTAISMSVGGRMVDRMGARRPAVAGCMLMMAGAAGNAFISPRTSVWWIASSLAVQGMGVGLVMIPVTVVGLNAIADHSMAHATTIRSLTNQVSAALSVAGLFALINARLASAGSVRGEQSAYNSAFIVAMVVLAMAMVISWRMPTGAGRTRAG